MRYQAVVFDMDGVIFDSERLVLKGWKKAAEKWGIDNIEDVFYQCIGVNRVVTREIFLTAYGADFPYEEFRAYGSKFFQQECVDGVVPMKPGVRELLGYLRDKGYRIGLASSTRHEVVSQEIEAAGLSSLFDQLTCGDMTKRSKPEPDIFLLACEKLGVKPENAIAIEDSYNGVRAANRAGMMAIMVPDLVPPDDEMRELAGEIMVDLFAVKDWIQEFDFDDLSNEMCFTRT